MGPSPSTRVAAVSDQTLISYAQNGEDVVLWRALGHVTSGRYIDVGACDPVSLSVTKAFYDRGWRGIDIDPVAEYAARLRAERPDNEVVEAAVTDQLVDTVTLHQFSDTGLSTLLQDTAAAHERAGFERRDITVPALTLDTVCERSTVVADVVHFLKIDVEGAEADVLRSFDLARWRPWVVLVEATRPLSTEPSFEDWDPVLTAAGYSFCLFDGLSRFYVSPDHPELAAKLSYPACVLDDYVPVAKHLQDVRVDELGRDVAEARREVVLWRNHAVGYWANAVSQVQVSEDAANRARSQAERLRNQLARLRPQLQQARADRKRLRARVRRLITRIERLKKDPPVLPGRRGRLRDTVKKVVGR